MSAECPGGRGLPGNLGQQAQREVPRPTWQNPPELPRDPAVWVHPLQPSDPGSLCPQLGAVRRARVPGPEAGPARRRCGPQSCGARMEYPKHRLPQESCPGEWAGVGSQMSPCLPWAPGRERELESPGQRSQLVLGRGRRGFVMDSPIDSRPWSQLGRLAWLGRQGQAEASPSLGKQPEEV